MSNEILDLLISILDANKVIDYYVCVEISLERQSFGTLESNNDFYQNSLIHVRDLFIALKCSGKIDE